MAGYLGTLFMANVGMRLLLPPQSQFAKASTRFGKMLESVGQEAHKYTRSQAQVQKDNLKKSLNEGALLSKNMTDKNKKATTESLRRTLDEISRMENSEIRKTGDKYQMTTDKYGSAGRAYQAHTFFQQQQTAVNRYIEALSSGKDEVSEFVGGMVALGDAVGYAGDFAFNTFRGALTTSVTLLTTFGYAIRGLTQEFGSFERELINANSIWQETNETLYSISDQVLKFGEEYGVAYENAASSLYQFASAGLTAAESQKILTEVLTLAMAVQGDANTIGKLTVQTIKGFGLEMDEAGIVTDKFAHAINASLIEYQDLAAAIKFALPFFSATNQNLDQLLGSIQVLTNRALEAGIAGRGLRQALAEFAEGAEDATRKFSEMGIKVVDGQGNFLKLTQIARNFSDAVGTEIANDVELLTTLIEDLNIRGATAFIHLVQNVDEFESAVNDLANAQGASKKMADIQQDSLVMQIQLLKNAAKEVFYLSDATYVAQGYMNEFDYVTKSIVKNFKEAFIVELADGNKQLTEFGFNIREAVIVYMKQFADLSVELINHFIELSKSGFNLAAMMKVLFYPVKIVLDVMIGMDALLGKVGGTGLIMKWYFLSMIFGRWASALIIIADKLTEVTRQLTGGGKLIMQAVGIASMFYGGGAMLKGGRAVLGTKAGKAALNKSGWFRKVAIGRGEAAAAGKTGAEYGKAFGAGYQSMYDPYGKMLMAAGTFGVGYGANTYMTAGAGGEGTNYSPQDNAIMWGPGGDNGYNLYIENAMLNNTNLSDTFYVAGLNQ